MISYINVDFSCVKQKLPFGFGVAFFGCLTEKNNES